MTKEWICRLRRARLTCLGLSSAGLLLYGCASSRSRVSGPIWWDNPHQHDSEHLYFKAEGMSAVGLEQARQNALRAIQAQGAGYVYTEIRSLNGVQESQASYESTVELRELEVFAEEEARNRSGWTVWMLGRYPRSEYNRIREKMECGAQLERQWKEAQSAVNRQQMQEAERLLGAIIETYDTGLRMSFALEAVKLELAGLYLRQNRGLTAKHWLLDVQKSTLDKTWRAKAADMLSRMPAFSCKDAFEGKAVGVYCCRGENGVVSADPRLTQELSGRLMKDGITVILLPEATPSLVESMDAAATKRITDAFKPFKVDAVFVTVLDVDTSKTGSQVSIPFTTEKIEALDATLRYMVVRSADGAILASDSTAGYSHAVPGMVAVMLTHPRHLPNYATVIAEGLKRDEGSR
jgi:hypothetical protein